MHKRALKMNAQTFALRKEKGEMSEGDKYRKKKTKQIYKKMRASVLENCNPIF